MNTRRGLIAIIVAHLALGLVYAWATPIFEAPDEGHHVGVIEWLRQGHGLPVQDPAREKLHPSIYAQEGSQPPLYYVLGWVATSWLPAGDFEIAQTENPMTRMGNPLTTHNPNLYRPLAAPGETWMLVMTLRGLSLAMSCFTLVLSYRLARRITGNDSLALLTAAFVAFNPMVLFINASATNDNLVMLLNTATLVALADLWFEAGPLRLRHAFGVGLLLGLSALTKLNGLVLWPIAALVIAYRGLGGADILAGSWGGLWRSLTSGARWRTALKDILRYGVVVFVVALAVAGWWYLRNLLLYGELFGTNTMVAIAGPRSIDLVRLIVEEWYGFFLSFWGVFGVFTIVGPEWVNTLFAVVTLGAIAGGLWSLSRGALERQAVLPGHAFGVVLLTFCLITLAALIRWTQQTYASQGRLMYGAIAPLALALAYGWWYLARKARVEAAAWAVPAALAMIALYLAIVEIRPRYEPPPVVAEGALPADLHRVEARLGDGLDLIGYTFDDGPRRPGEGVSFTLYWRATTKLSHDDVLALVVYGRDQAVLTQIDTWPGGGSLPPGNMEPGAIYADAYTLPLTRTASAPTLLTLRLGLWRDKPEQRLPTTTFAGEPIQDPALTVGRLLAPVPEAVPPDRSYDDGSWGGVDVASATVHLRGLDLGNDGAVTLWWEGGGTPADATLFIHLLDIDGQQIDQADGPTLGGAWPLPAWVAGQPFSETRRFSSVTTPLAGAYTLRLGWYDPATGQRLPAWRSDGTRWADDAVLIEMTP